MIMRFKTTARWNRFRTIDISSVIICSQISGYLRFSNILGFWIIYIPLKRWHTDFCMLVLNNVCWLVNACVFTICAQHSDGLVKLQGTDFPFCLCRLLLKTFPCLTVWPPTISWRFLLSLNATIDLVWNTPSNWMFICKIFQFLFKILDITRIVLLYVLSRKIIFLFLFSLFVKGNFP